MGKTFTLEEANKTLVFVAPVLKEILHIWEELMAFQTSNEIPNEFIRSKIERLRSCHDELVQVGCAVKDPIQGILVFPSFYGEQAVFLSWKIGEVKIAYWQNLNGGQRERVDDDFLDKHSKEPLSRLNLV